MGNKQSQSNKSKLCSEMSSAKDFPERKTHTEPLCDLDELWVECLELKSNVQQLVKDIDEIFDENDDSNDSAMLLETRLHQMTQRNQIVIKKLTRHLERHAKNVDQGAEKNERLMAIVKELVSTVNGYMTMLVRNIRKLKRLVTEIQVSSARGINYCSRQSRNKAASLIYDVIDDHQDVDAMLIQLMQTEKHREDLEKDIVSVLVFWRDYRIYLREEEPISLGEIEADVQAAADSVSHGVAKLSVKN